MFTIHETLPTLYGKDISGKPKQWTATVYTDGLKAKYTVEYGQVGGKMQTTSTDYTEGKNIGKKNETTPLEQCIAETRRKWLDKKEKESYQETVPMQADGDTHTHTQRYKHKHTYTQIDTHADKETIDR